MNKRLVGQIFAVLEPKMNAYRYTFVKIPSSLAGNFIQAVHELAKSEGEEMQPLRVFVHKGIQISLAKDRAARAIQRHYMLRVEQEYEAWYEESANVWKVERRASVYAAAPLDN